MTHSYVTSLILTWRDSFIHETTFRTLYYFDSRITAKFLVALPKYVPVTVDHGPIHTGGWLREASTPPTIYGLTFLWVRRNGAYCQTSETRPQMHYIYGTSGSAYRIKMWGAAGSSAPEKNKRSILVPIPRQLEVLHSYVWDSFVCDTRLIRTCDMTHSYAGNDWSTCVTQLIHIVVSSAV